LALDGDKRQEQSAKMSDNAQSLDENDIFADSPDLPDRNEDDFFRSKLRTARKRAYLGEEDAEKLHELARIHTWARVSANLDHDDGDFKGDNENVKTIKLWLRKSGPTSVKTDLANLYAAGLSITMNGWVVEHLVVFSCCLTAAIAYSLAPTPSSPHLASQLDFHVSLSTFHTCQVN
jgi:hypothetical protein